MPSALRFRVPVQGAGIGPHQENGVEWSHVYNISGAANGYTKWSRQWNLTGFTHDTEFHVRTRNRGSGGRHQRWEKSTDGTTVATMTDAGLMAATAITSTVTTGTAPLVVASTTLVSNLNADLLDGLHASAFALTTDLDDYLPLTGGEIDGDLDITGELQVDGDVTLGNSTSNTVTIPGSLTVDVDTSVNGDFDVDGESSLMTTTIVGVGSPGNDQALFLQHNAAAGVFSLGASNAADPVLIFKDNSGDQTFEVGNSASTYQARVLGAGNVTGSLTVGGGISAGASSAFTGGVSVVTGDLSILSGQLNATSGIENTGGTVRFENSGNARFESNSTGVGFFGATPIARPTVVGDRNENAALENLLEELENLGLITNLTT